MSQRGSRQLLVLGLASCLWSVAGQVSALALVLAYLAAVVLLELPPARRWVPALGVGQLLLLAALLAAPGVAFGVRNREQLWEHEGLAGASARLRDRLRLTGAPAIAPGLLASDRPQTSFVHAPGAARVAVAVGGRKLALDSLGAGLFRLDYDPRRDGVPIAQSGRAELSIETDHTRARREIELVAPLVHPRWFCLAPDREHAATVSEETDELFWFDRSGLVGRQHVGDGPVDCAFTASDQLALSYRNQTVLELWSRTATRPSATLELGAGQGRLVRSPSGALLAVAVHGRASAIVLVNSSDLQLRQRVELTHPADWLVFGPDDETLLASTRGDALLHRLRRSSSDARYREDAMLALGRPPATLARSQDGATLMAATTDLQAPGQAQLGNHFVQDQLLGIDVESMRVRAQRFTAERSPRQSKPGDVDRGLSPLGLWQRADGAWLVSFAGSDELTTLAPDFALTQPIDLGEHELYAPHGVVGLADGTRLVSSPTMGAIGIWAPLAQEPRVIRLGPSDASLLERDHAALARRVGERGFYEGTRSGIACQSCHLHGDSDDAAYNLGDRRLLPTLTVRGLFGTAPYLRDGTYPRVRDLDHVAQTLYRGYLRNQAARGATIEAFVEALPRRENPGRFERRELATERRGWAAFRKAGCDHCHAPPAFTNLAQLPLRALFPELAATFPDEEMLDTPSLLSISASAPYLSDGRASSLEDVIDEHNQQNRHGDVRALAGSERRDLLAFLRTL